MENNRPKMPDEKLGKFCIIAGSIMVILPLFLSRMDWGQRLPAIAGGLGGLSWGLNQVAAAKEWRRNYGEPTPEEQREIKKSHSVSNLSLLLTWLVFGIVVLAFLGFVFTVLFQQER